MRRGLALALVLAGAARADDVLPRGALGAEARELQFQVRKTISLKARTESPPFFAIPPPHLLDRGKALFVGRGAVPAPELVYVVDLPTLEGHVLQAPTAAFAAEHPELGLSPVVEDVACLDRADGRAALVLKDVKGARVYVAWWDTAKNVITEAIPVGEKEPKDHWIGAQPIGYQPATGECFLQVERGDATYSEAVVAVGREPVAMTVATFTAKYITSHGPYFDAAHRRAVVTEISEVEGAEPKGYLVDLAKGDVRPFAIPQLVYGFTFDPDGRTLYAYGVKAKELWAIDAATGAARKRTRLGDIGHALGWIGDSLVVVGNVRIHLLDPRTFAHRGQIGTRRIVPDSVNVENSVVLPDATIALDNFSKLTFTRLQP